LCPDDFSGSKCASSVMSQSASAAMAQSANLSSLGSAVIRCQW
jgi:hypothetical protein